MSAWLISQKHRLVFVHIHKTAGSSVAAALADATGVAMNTYRGQPLHNHASRSLNLTVTRR